MSYRLASKGRRYQKTKDGEAIGIKRLLIGIPDIVNKLVALFVIVSSTLSGYSGDLWDYVGVEYPGTGRQLIGFIAGLILAALVSGFIAAIIHLAREATTIREILAARPSPPP